MLHASGTPAAIQRPPERQQTEHGRDQERPAGDPNDVFMVNRVKGEKRTSEEPQRPRAAHSDAKQRNESRRHAVQDEIGDVPASRLHSK